MSFDKVLEKATSSLLLEVDWDCILKLCDIIRQGDVQPKYAIGQIKKKTLNDNINVVVYSLQCLESIVKNCGTKIHQEIATKDFLDHIKMLIGTKPDPIKSKLLELIQCWQHALKKNPNFKIIEDYYTAMKLEGYKFPVLNEADAMFDADEAPAWKDDSESTNCFRCRAEFTTLKRRHHCRACGQIFCHGCSSKVSTIPKYGIEKEVRVCDVCFDKIK
jgi:hepatocyte growth factor-regulated tyrosine kinase substrate